MLDKCTDLIYCPNNVLVYWCQDRILFREFRVKVCSFFFAFLKEIIRVREYAQGQRVWESYNFWFEGGFDPPLLQVPPLDVSEERMVFDCFLAAVVL